MELTPAELHEAAVTAALGPEGRMISLSKTAYRDANPNHVIVFNANVCVAAGKLWFGDFDLTLDEDQLLDLAARTGEIVYLLYEHDGRFKHEDAPLLDKAVYSASPSGHNRFGHTSVERRADGRLYERPLDRPPRWRRPNPPHLWRPWHVDSRTECHEGPHGTQRSRLIYLGQRGLGPRSPLLVLGLHSWPHPARGAWVEWTWYPSGGRRWAPSLAPRVAWPHGPVRPFIGLRFTPGLSHELRLGISLGSRDESWG